VESSQTVVRINAIGRGEDIGLSVNILAVTITTTVVVVFTGRHCYKFATVSSGDGVLGDGELATGERRFVMLLIGTL
jgi:hypothetical protein